MDYQPFYTLNLLSDKELLPTQKMQKLAILKGTRNCENQQKASPEQNYFAHFAMRYPVTDLESTRGQINHMYSHLSNKLDVTDFEKIISPSTHISILQVY